MPPDDFENSMSDDATYAGVSGRSSVEKSLGEEGTLSDKFGDQETVIDDSEVVDLDDLVIVVLSYTNPARLPR